MSLEILAALLAAAIAPSQPPATAPSTPTTTPAASATPSAAPTPVLPRNEAFPPSDAQAKEALEKTPRHGEWSDIVLTSAAGASTKIKTFVAFPERKDKAPVVLVIHEVYGLTDWIRATADQLAREGFIAVAPDLLSGMGPGGGGTEAFASRDDAVTTIRTLSPADATARLDAVREWALKLPAANGRSAAIGFCWGGARSFAYATTQPKLDAAVVYYGTSPDAAALASLKVPVLGLYGGDDARVNATIDPAKAAVAAAGGTYEVDIYEGAGHGFLRGQGERDGVNLLATQAAWPRTTAFLKLHTTK